MGSSRKKPAKKPRGKGSETAIHMNCQQWLEQSGAWNRLLIFHVPNERKGGVGAIIYFKRLGVRDGVADYLAFPPGRKVAIEIKRNDGKQRKGQEDFERDWQASGGVYVVVRTLEEFQGVINALLLFA